LAVVGAWGWMSCGGGSSSAPKHNPAPVAVSAADAALHLGLCTYEEIAAALAGIKRHRGAPRARQALALADGRAESPGESWPRLALTHA